MDAFSWGKVSAAAAVMTVAVMGVAAWQMGVDRVGDRPAGPKRPSAADCRAVFEVSKGVGGSEDISFRNELCEESQIAATVADEYSPALSGDATKVAYVRRNPEGSTLVVADISTKETSDVLTSSLLVGGPAWSPRGDQLAYWKGDGNDRPDIWTLDLSSGVETRVTSDPAVETQASWSPDGRFMAFTRSEASGSRVVVTDLHGSERFLSIPNSALKLPTWSPDGTRIAAIEDVEQTGTQRLVTLNSMDGAKLAESGTWEGPTVSVGWLTAGIRVAVPAGEVGAARTLEMAPDTLAVTRTETHPGVPAWPASEEAAR